MQERRRKRRRTRGRRRFPKKSTSIATSFCIIFFLFIGVKMLNVPSHSLAVDENSSRAIQEYCPVSYLVSGKALMGDPAISFVYLGKTWYFADDESRQKFMKQPDRYLPQFDGLCTTALGGSYGNRLPNDPTVFDVRNGKLYLFSSERAKRAYERKPRKYIARCEELFNTPRMRGFCAVSYQTKNKAIKGDEKNKSVYGGWVYHFAGAQERELFISNPDLYLPQYDGYCPLGVSQGKKYPGDPNFFHVVSGKTYFFFNQKDKTTFMKNPQEGFTEADANWPVLATKKD